MKTTFPIKENHIPKWFLIDASKYTLGSLATKVSTLLSGKYKNFYTPGVDQGNFVVIINSKQIKISGKKENKKFYFHNSNRPGSLKKETFKQLQLRIPGRVIEKSIYGMLPKGTLGNIYYKRLYVYNTSPIFLLNNKNIEKI
jgi:large subunit ribosomal protein L13